MLVAYFCFRLLLLPSDPVNAFGFTADGAYLTIVANNLLSGKGLVLDALWFVFLNPDSLPMPYHNANPLFPIAMAAVKLVTGVSVPLAAFLLSILSSTGLIVATFFLVRPYVPFLQAAIAAGLVALFPPIWVSSCYALTDELWLALVVASLAFLVRSAAPRYAFLAGALLGLAWLTRSAAITVAPAMAVWIVIQLGWRNLLRTGARIGIAFLVMISPWLVHTAMVWGDPLRSDLGQVTAIHVYRGLDESPQPYWHRPLPVPSVSQMFRDDPGRVLWRIVRGIPPLAREWLRASAEGSVTAVLVLYLGAGTLLFLRPPRWKSPEFLASLCFIVLSVTPLTFIGIWIETRYFLLVYFLFCVWLFVGLLSLAFSKPLKISAIFCLACGVVYIAYVPWFDAKSVSEFRAENRPRKEYFHDAMLMNQTVTKSPVVVGTWPYYYTLATGAQSLSIPNADDEFLLSYMNKYHARFVFLTAEERELWRPKWRSEHPAFLRQRPKIGDCFVYELAN